MKTILPLLVLLFVAGCNSRYKSRPAEAEIKAGATTITQTGNAQVPASSNVETAKRTIPLPAASELVFDESKPGVITLRLSKDSQLVSESRVERAVGPTSFTPPAPPTPQDEAEGKADFWSLIGYRIGLVLGLGAAVFGLVRGWDFVMWGGLAIGGGCAFGLFVQKHPVLFALIGVGLALAVLGPWFWHRHLKRTTPANEPA